MKENIQKNPYLTLVLATISLLFLTPLMLGGSYLKFAFFLSLRNPLIVSFVLLATLLFIERYRTIFYSFFLKEEFEINNSFERNALIFIIVFYFFVFLKVIYNNYYSFNVSAGDFSAYANLIPNTLAGKFMYAEGMNRNHFGVHFTPIIYLMWPLYLIFKTPLVVLYFHPILILSTLLPLYLVMKKRDISPVIRILTVFSFLNYVYVAQILKFNFHIEVFYIPLFMWLFYAIENSKKSLFFIAIILINLVKEDGALYLISTLVAFLFVFKQSKKIIITGIFFSLIYFVINMKFIMPYFQDGDVVKLLGNRYGATLPMIIKGMLNNWYKVIYDYFSVGWLKVILCFLFIPMISPFFVISTLFFALIHVGSGDIQMNKLSIYYSAPIIAHVFYSLTLLLKRRFKIGFFNKTLFKRIVIFIIFILCNLTGGSYHKFHVVNDDYDNFSKLSVLIKENLGETCVQNAFFPHLKHSINNYFISGGCLDRAPKFILLSDKVRTYPYSKEYISKLIELYQKNNNYETIKKDDFYLFINKGV